MHVSGGPRMPDIHGVGCEGIAVETTYNNFGSIAEREARRGPGINNRIAEYRIAAAPIKCQKLRRRSPWGKSR
eukprot:326359-Pyramimonas_sp.AAC.1